MHEDRVFYWYILAIYLDITFLTRCCLSYLFVIEIEIRCSSTASKGDACLLAGLLSCARFAGSCVQFIRCVMFSLERKYKRWIVSYVFVVRCWGVICVASLRQKNNYQTLGQKPFEQNCSVVSCVPTTLSNSVHSYLVVRCNKFTVIASHDRQTTTTATSKVAIVVVVVVASCLRV